MTITTDLLNWYYENHRQLPWRETTDPYKIWISEIMLQQTQVDTVIGYYHRFLEAFPDVHALAAATEDQVFKLWQGLGYYSRARNLHKSAQIIHQAFAGDFPRTYEALAKLPGIGPYTTGAILSIAYNLPYPAVDGNVLRVMTRWFNLHMDISDPKTRPDIEKRVKELLPEDCRHFNQAFMDLGATICKPNNPDCTNCPVAKHCQAYKNETVHLLPIKTKKIQKKILKMAVAYLKHEDSVFLIKRDEPLLGGLWGFPLIEIPESLTATETLMAYIDETYGISASFTRLRARKKHVFTHMVWDMAFIELNVTCKSEDLKGSREWVQESQLSNYAIPKAFLKLLES